MVKYRSLLCYADRILRRHHVSERANVRSLHMRTPPGVEYAGRWAYLVALRVEVVLDCRDPPNPKLVGSLDDVEPLVKYLMIDLLISTEGAPAFTVGPVSGREHRIDLQDDFRLSHFRNDSVACCLASQRFVTSEGAQSNVVQRSRQPNSGYRASSVNAILSPA